MRLRRIVTVIYVRKSDTNKAREPTESYKLPELLMYQQLSAWKTSQVKECNMKVSLGLLPMIRSHHLLTVT
jgi:hypothetical protein